MIKYHTNLSKQLLIFNPCNTTHDLANGNALFPMATSRNKWVMRIKRILVKRLGI